LRPAGPDSLDRTPSLARSPRRTRAHCPGRPEVGVESIHLRASGARTVPRDRGDPVSASEMSLDALAIRHSADKSSKVHGYTRVYEKHFGPIRNEPVVLLEIGVGSGASLRTWRDYFNRAQLYGLDMGDCKHLEISGTHIFQGSQSDESVLERLI